MLIAIEGEKALHDIDPYLPTEALPGTLQKVAVLEARASMGIPLWNPNDATWDSFFKLFPTSITHTHRIAHHRRLA